MKGDNNTDLIENNNKTGISLNLEINERFQDSDSNSIALCS